MKALVDEALAESPSVEHVVVWRRLDCDAPMRPGRDVWWD
jgi:acetyl-CoA synthetase